ncbi:hypothetical protein [Caulobacter sp. BE254]|uniref:hypothetical protein n=1 Tax=Caulobacter sp. BE254 TaxID=2817720 RepID=UPI002866316B|nr:hypothetical protein [Caulobacter sp. BE254]MDR7118357.1 hypothetical protein [Caulobacter sp. BE254]
MKFPIVGALAAIAFSLVAVSAQAQSGGPPPPQAIPGKLQYDANRVGRAYDQLRAASVLGAPRRSSGNPLQVKAAIALASELKAPCDVTDAAELKNGHAKAPDGSTITVQTYEIVCKDSLGWIISKSSDGTSRLTDCLALQTGALAAGKAWPKGYLCGLPENGTPFLGLRPIAAKVAPSCALVDGVYMGAGGQPPILRYEIACKDGKGFVVDAPAPGSSAALQAINCDEAKAAGAACTLIDKKRG